MSILPDDERAKEDQNNKDRRSRSSFIRKTANGKVSEAPGLRQLDMEKVAKALDEQDGQRIVVRAKLADPRTRIVEDSQNRLKLRAIISDQIDRIYRKTLLAPQAEDPTAGELTADQVTTLRSLSQLMTSLASSEGDLTQESDDEFKKRMLVRETPDPDPQTA